MSALTTIFTPPASCFNNQYTLGTDLAGTEYIKDLLITSSTCYPSNFHSLFTNSIAYSPGACPNGYTAGLSPAVSGAITAVTCCPSGMTGSSGGLGCYSTISSPTAIASGAETTTVSSGVLAAHAVYVKWQSSDLNAFTPASAPLRALATMTSVSSTRTTTSSTTSTSSPSTTSSSSKTTSTSMTTSSSSSSSSSPSSSNGPSTDDPSTSTDPLSSTALIAGGGGGGGSETATPLSSTLPPTNSTVGNAAESTDTSSPSSSNSSGLSGGAIAGIVIGSVVGLGLLIAAGVFAWLYARPRPSDDKVFHHRIEVQQT